MSCIVNLLVLLTGVDIQGPWFAYLCSRVVTHTSRYSRVGGNSKHHAALVLNPTECWVRFTIRGSPIYKFRFHKLRVTSYDSWIRVQSRKGPQLKSFRGLQLYLREWKADWSEIGYPNG